MRGDGGTGAQLKAPLNFAPQWRAQTLLSSAGIDPGVLGTSTNSGALSIQEM